MSACVGRMGVGLGHTGVPILALYELWNFSFLICKMQLPTSIWGKIRRQKAHKSSWHTTSFPQMVAIFTGLQDAARNHLLLTACSFIQQSLTPALPQKGTEGRGILALALKTFYPSYAGPKTPQETPQQKGSFPQIKGLCPPRPGTASSGTQCHSLSAPRFRCKQLFGPPREWRAGGKRWKRGAL